MLAAASFPMPRPDGRTSRRAAPRVGLGVAALLAAVVLHNTLTVLRLRRAAGVDPGEHERDAVVGDPEAPPLRLIVLGDSAARGYGLDDATLTYPFQVATQLADRAGRAVHVTSLAEDGARTRQLLNDQVPALRGLHPDVVVVSAGVNDALNRTPRRQVEVDTRRLLDALAALVPDARVVMAGTPDLSAAPGFPWPMRWLVGVLCRRVRRTQAPVATFAGVPFVDYARPDVHMFGVDGFHPGAAGQAAAARRTVDVLLAAAPTLAAGTTPRTDPQQEQPWISD